MTIHESFTVSDEGDILPSYTGVNQPQYARGKARDTEMPHDFDFESIPATDTTAIAPGAVAMSAATETSITLPVVTEEVETPKLGRYDPRIQDAIAAHRARETQPDPYMGSVARFVRNRERILGK